MTSPEILLEIPKPDDFHIHLRQGEDLQQYTHDVAYSFRRVLAMPNTLPPLKTPEDLTNYRAQITKAAGAIGLAQEFTPLLTFKLGADVPATSVKGLKEAGAVAGKLYPQGATTNSEDGVQDLREMYSLIEAMEAEDLVLCIHGEDPTAFSLDREAAFLPKVAQLVRDFPRLRIVMEHITTSDAVTALNSFPDRVGATITLHHLLNNLDDLIGGFLNPHLFCKPVLKAPNHQQALVNVVLQGHPRIFFGSDSAPHSVDQKECACGCAGVYTAPVALPLLAEFFRAGDFLQGLEPFTCHRGADFYGLPRAGSQDTDPRVALVAEAWTVPAQYGRVVPYAAGSTVPYRVQALEVKK